MRTTVPPAFEMSFTGPEGQYSIHFRPTDEWDGTIDVCIAGVGMKWEVTDADREDGGGLVLSGMTSDSEPLWDDQYWFEMRLDDTPPVIRYWGDQVVWREDRAT